MTDLTLLANESVKQVQLLSYLIAVIRAFIVQCSDDSETALLHHQHIA